MTNQALPGEPRTLVVDDHDISSRYTLAALRQSTGSVKHARDAREALSIAVTWLPELIFMDIQLPDSNGIAVIRKIREAWPNDRRRPRIVVLTAENPAFDLNDLAGLDIECILLKPVTTEEIRDAARIHRSHTVMEARPAEHVHDLRALFVKELARRLPELDRSLTRLDWRRSAAILHQLIASSALCEERQLESDLRSLDCACREGVPPAQLARAYYALLESARDFTNRIESEAS